MSSPEQYNALKGVQDIFAPDIFLWQKAEAAARDIFVRYGFGEIRPPIIEPTALFIRSIGETTDIVEKEMYTFPDRAGRSITLRPEGTASVVRAYIENNLYTLPSPQKYFYTGPMFRYERPQKGRFRQFHQIGAETFGSAAPEADAEILAMLKLYLNRLEMTNLSFEMNSIGCAECRPSFREALTGFFSGRLGELCPDCTRRYRENPLRILDCKVERCGEVRQDAPLISDSICGGCREHFAGVLAILGSLGIPVVTNPHLVRGLDYYTRTTFEVTSEHLGAQKAVAAGGRYDRLVEEFGGPPTPAVGFAVGMERLIALMKEKNPESPPSPDVFIAALGKNAVREGLLIAERLRVRGLRADVGYDGTSLKSQLRRADRLSSRYALIIGDNELSSGRITWKNLRNGEQGVVDIGRMDSFISSLSPDKTGNSGDE